MSSSLIITDDQHYTDIATAIRGKNGSSDTYKPSEMAAAITAIPTGGGTLQAKTGINPTTSSQTIEPDNGYYGLSSVQINAMPSGSANPPSTISGTGASISASPALLSNATLTLSTNSVSVTPSVTPGYISAGTHGFPSISLTATVNDVKNQVGGTFHPSSSDQTIQSKTYFSSAYTIKGVTTTNLSASNIKSGVTVEVGDSADSDRIVSVTGTHTGGGGSMNVQANISIGTKIASTSYVTTGLQLTVSKSGTYSIYWTGFRSTSSGTSGTRIYKNGSAIGTAHTTWASDPYQIQACSETGIQLSEDDVIAVYARSRSASYYADAANLIIVQTA